MSDQPREIPPGINLSEKKITFDYIKSNYFRTVHVDGVYGGASPKGDLRLSIWNERWPIPKQVVYALNEDGSIGKELREERISRAAIVREVEVDLTMEIDVARKLRDWLIRHIKSVEEAEIQSETEQQ